METETESYENFPENRGLLFVNLRLLDEKGRLVYGAENEVHVELEGDGRLLAFGSAHSEHRKGYAYGSALPEGGELLGHREEGKRSTGTSFHRRRFKRNRGSALSQNLLLFCEKNRLPFSSKKGVY